MAKHYFCPSCGGVDWTAHECRTETCDLKDQPLQECDCDDPNSHRKPKQPTMQTTQTNEE